MLIGSSSVIFAAGAFSLVGCGGLFASTGPGIGTTDFSASFKSVQVTITSPAGIDPANLKLTNGRGATKVAHGASLVLAIVGIVSTVILYDSVSGKGVMIGTVDTSSNSNHLDFANMAATLIFQSLGGSQLLTTLRNNCWAAILIDPATQTFAGVVANRLASNPFALNDNDPGLKAGLDAAIASLNSATLAAARPSSHYNSAVPLALSNRENNRNRMVSKRPDTNIGYPQIPSPAVFYDFVGEIDLGLGMGTYYRQKPVSDVIDLANHGYTKPWTYEAAILAYDIGTMTAHGFVESVTKPRLAGPVQFGMSRVRQSFQTFPLADASDKSRYTLLTLIKPFFDDPVSNGYFGGLNKSLIDEVLQFRADMYERAAVQIAICLFLDALGIAGIPYDVDILTQVTNNLAQNNGPLSAAVINARHGKDIFSTVNGITSAAVADDASLTYLLAALTPVIGKPIFSNDTFRVLAKSVFQYGAQYSLNNYFAGNDLAFQLGGQDDHKSISPQYIGTYPVLFSLQSSVGAYNPGGDPVDISIVEKTYKHKRSNENFAFGQEPIDPDSYFTIDSSDIRKYHYKLTGNGGATLVDKAGKGGVEFDSTSRKVSLNTTARTTGDQLIEVTIYNTENGPPVLAGSVNITLFEGGLKLNPPAPILDLNAQQIFTASPFVGSFAAGTTFKWTLTGNGSIGSSPVSTTVPSISYTAPSTTTVDTLQVEALDASLKLVGRASATISVATPSRITPHNPFVKLNGTQVFTVAPIAGNYPTGSTYTWSLTGKGSIGSSNPVTTSLPQISYKGSSTDSTDNLLVTVKDSNGKTIATTGTVITVSNTQVVTATMHWYVTKTYSHEAGRTSGEFYGLAVFSALPGAKKYELKITGPDGNHNNSFDGTLTAAQLAAGAPVWDATETLYQNPNPANFPVPYGGKQFPDVPTEKGFYNAGGGIAWYYSGGEISSTNDNFAAAFATIMGQQQTPASQDTFTITVTF